MGAGASRPASNFLAGEDYPPEYTGQRRLHL